MGIYGYLGPEGRDLAFDPKVQPCILCGDGFDLCGTTPNIQLISIGEYSGYAYYTYTHSTCYKGLDAEGKEMVRLMVLTSAHLDAELAQKIQKPKTVN